MKLNLCIIHKSQLENESEDLMKGKYIKLLEENLEESLCKTLIDFTTFKFETSVYPIAPKRK